MSWCRRAAAVLVLAAMMAPGALAACHSPDAGGACPFADDNCCAALRVTCCEPEPAPAPATPPPSPDGLGVPLLRAVTLPASSLAVAPVPDAGRKRPEISPPRDADDLPVFLHILLI